jgi:PQQ-dependent dehydrogenase (methanol/ethanol family)
MLEDPVEPATPFPQAPAVFGSASSDRPGDDEIAHPDPEQWLMYNKDFTGQRYSQLDRVDAGNAASLVPVCIFQPGEIGAFQTAPVVYDGTMYITTPYNTFAIDATNCRKLWEHRYPAGKAAPWTVNRGVALYRGKIFRVTPNGHLIALDAKTGKLLWDVWMVSNHHGYWLSAAPVAYRGLVYMGTAGADWGANGFIEAFDSETGKLRWKFDVIPTGKETGAETWGKGSATGGGAFWSTFAIDTGTDQLLVPVGNPAPAFRDDLRPGDNLFTDSVVALDLRSGKLAWWAQQVPHDTHDWDTAASPTLYSADGRDMMAVANKGGWLYLYDRRTQALVSKLEISPHENVDVPLTRQGVHHCPGTLGGAEWNGAAYSPDARTLFVNSVHWCSTTQVFDDQYIEGSSYFDGVPALDPVGEAKGFLRAVDAGTGKELWVRKFDNPMVAAVTPTAGGVLFTGSLDGNFLVLDSRDGKTLYHFDTGGAIAGAPSTYLVKDRQYVAVPSGNSSRVVWQTGGAMMLAIFALHEQAPGK